MYEAERRLRIRWQRGGGAGQPQWAPVLGSTTCGGPYPTVPVEAYRNGDVGPLGVVLSNGDFQITVTDLEIPGRGFPFKLTRTYRGQRDVVESTLGYNWFLGYDEYLTRGVYNVCAGGYPAVEWKMADGFKDRFVDWGHGDGYHSFNGFFGKLRSLGTSDGPYQIRYPDGTVKTFASNRLVDNTSRWVLTKIEDRKGNVMTFQFYDNPSYKVGLVKTVTDTLGRAITFDYDNDGRLISVVDFNNRRVDYHYDGPGTDGNLDWVKAPEVTGTPTGNDFRDNALPTPPRKQTSYSYLGSQGCTNASLKHNLFEIKDGKGQTFLRNTYLIYGGEASCGITGPSTTNDFVATQTYGDPTLGQSVNYTYAPLSAPPTPTPNMPVYRTTITDRNGNVQVHDFNIQGNPLRVEYQTRGIRTLAGAPELPYVETWTYVDPGDGTQPLLVSVHTEPGGFNVDANGSLISYAGGMTVQYTYDQASGDPSQRGNLLSVVRTPGSRGAPAGQEQIVTSYTYESLFNQPLTVTDPQGHVTSFIYDYQEGNYDQLTAAPTPAPVDPAWFGSGLSYWMSLSGNSSLGDLNGDYPIYQRRGNLIRVSEGQPTGYYDLTPGAEITTTTAYNDCGLPTIQRDAEFNETHFYYFPENMPDGSTSTTLPTPDSRTLRGTGGTSGTLDATGCGYLRQKVLDAAATMTSARPAGPDRDSGQTPPAQNINLSFKYDPVGNVKQATDGRGIQTDYWVNTLNQVVQMTHASVSTAPGAPAFSYLEQFFYDANNNVTQQRTERRENCTPTAPETTCWTTQTFVYDWLDRKKSETVSTSDPTSISLTTSYDYDANGNLIQTVYPMGNVVRRQYDERDLLYREAALRDCPGTGCNSFDPCVDSVTQYDYDGSGNDLQVFDPEGTARVAQCAGTIDPTHVARTGYDGYNRKVVGFDPALQKTTFSYDKGGNILEKVSTGSLGGATPTGPPYRELSRQKFFYDELNRLRRTDTKFFKDDGTTITLLPSGPRGGLTGAPPDGLPADPGWVTSLLQYDRLGRVTRATDNNAHFTETRYDGLGRKLKVFLNPVAPFSDVSGTSSDERNAVEYQYDADSNLTRTIETERGLDRSGGGASARMLTTVQQYQTDLKYDSMNRLVESKLVGKVGAPTQLNYTTSVVYDSRGNKTKVTDPNGYRTRYSYDGLNRLLTTEAGYLADDTIAPGLAHPPVNPDGKITATYTYDDNSRLTSIQDDNLRTTSFLYDNLSRQTRITYPDNSYKAVTTYNRDSLATVWEHHKASPSTDKLKLTTQYDSLHRTIQKDVDNNQASYFIGTKRQSFEYDGLGRMTRAVDDQDPADAQGLLDSQVFLAYNSLGKVIQEDQKYGELVGGSAVYTTNTVSSVYNGVGFRTQLTYPGTGPRTITFTPDELNRLDTLTDSYFSSPNNMTKYDYLGPSRVLNRLYPNTTKLTMLSGSSDNVGTGYDDARRVKDWANKGGTAPPNVLPEFAYGYDPANNRRFERRVHQPNAGNWKGERYTYDAVYRLINRTEGDLDGYGELVGNPTPSQTFALDGLGNWKDYTKDGTSYDNTANVNSLNQYTSFVGPLGTRTLTYDFAGNLLSEGTGNNSYTYDFANRLVTVQTGGGPVTTYRYDALGRRISKNVGGTVTRFIYDGDQLIEERDSANGPVASYVYGIGSNEVLTRRRCSGACADLFYHTNALGSVTAVTDSTTGAVVERYQYDAYGKPTFLNASFGVLPGGSNVFNTILFTGQYQDVESGNYYYRARYYHPYLGRFLQRDPLGESESPNLYAYVSNNPINLADPTGMKTATYSDYSYSDLDAAGRQAADDDMAALHNMDGGAKGEYGGGARGSWGMWDRGQVDWTVYGRDIVGEHRAGLAAREQAHWDNQAARRAIEQSESPQQAHDDSKKRSAATVQEPSTGPLYTTWDSGDNSVPRGYEEHVQVSTPMEHQRYLPGDSVTDGAESRYRNDFDEWGLALFDKLRFGPRGGEPTFRVTPNRFPIKPPPPNTVDELVVNERGRKIMDFFKLLAKPGSEVLEYLNRIPKALLAPLPLAPAMYLNGMCSTVDCSDPPGA